MPHEICRWSGKVMHASKRDALHTGAGRKQRDAKHGRHRDAHIPRYAYRCPDCGAWHLTRVPQEPRKRRAG